MIRMQSLIPLLVASALWLGVGEARAAETVVQFPVTGILDARSVTTLTDGKLVVFNLPTDGGGLQNAYMTNAGAKLQNAPDGHALPDDGHFPANARHPEVVLHFSNTADATSPQTHLMAPSGMITFPVPSGTYSKLFLFFNGAAGGTTVKVTLTYSDATTEVTNAMVPDYYADVSGTDLVIFNLATDLAKWTKMNTRAEEGHHNITGVEVHPAAAKMLTNVLVERGPNGNLVFWGATGIATSAVVVGGGGAGAGGAAGAGGNAAGGASGAVAGGSAGAAAGGAGGTSGAGTAGAPAAGGTLSAGGGGAAPVTAAGSAPVPNSATDDSGCSVRVGAAAPRTNLLWLALGAVGAWRLARKRRSPVSA